MTTLTEKYQSINYVNCSRDDHLFATLDLLDDDDSTHLSRVWGTWSDFHLKKMVYYSDF